MSLAELQALFWQAVRDDRAPQGLDEAFVSRGALSATRRMEIYHAAYWSRHEKCLQDTYPRLFAELGDRAFRTLVAHYIAQRPSMTPCIEWAGQALPAHLRQCGHELGHDLWLADLAELEWARIAAWVAPDSPRTLTRAALASVDVTVRRLRTAPCLQLAFVHPNASARFMDTEAHADAHGSRTWVVVWRDDRQLHTLALAPDHGRALDQAQKGATLARACAEFDAPDAATRAAIAIGQWLDRGWMIGWEATDDAD